MTQRQILLSGDYWHQDFKGLISGFDMPVTMIAIEKLDRLSFKPGDFDLVVLAESRRDQISPELAEQIQAKFAGTPIVNLLGTWCEGETRSGSPTPGMVRVFWHQWEGRFHSFLEQLEKDEITSWHAPPTTTPADRILSSVPEQRAADSLLIGVSAWSQTQFEMVSDSLKIIGYRSKWLERSTWDAEAIQLLSAICIDATSLNDDLRNRVQWLRSTFPGPPMIAILNFPREHEAEELRQLDVETVLSKPFELADLMAAVTRLTEAETVAEVNRVFD